MTNATKDAVSVFNAIDALKPGETYVYWTGDLGMETAETHKNKKAALAAKRGAWDAYKAGIACLTQKRLTSGKDSAFAYRATRTRA